MRMSRHEEVEFDLLKGIAGFKMTSTFQQVTREQFTRVLRF